MAGGNAEWGSHSGKLNVQLPYEQESPPRNLPKGEKNTTYVHSQTCQRGVFIMALFVIMEAMERTQMSFSG